MCSGVAGSLAERLPILHVVGAPSTALQSKHSLLHHTLNIPTSFTTFSTMSKPISCSQALLSAIPTTSDTAWTDAFDNVLRDVLEQCRPGYLEFPTDAVHHKVSSKGLETKLVGPSLNLRNARLTSLAPPPRRTSSRVHGYFSPSQWAGQRSFHQIAIKGPDGSSF